MRYKDIFLPYIAGEYIEDDNRITCTCPFCRYEEKTMSINKANRSILLFQLPDERKWYYFFRTSCWTYT